MSEASPKSAKKRVLVRWNDDIDKQVLLTIQWACAENGVKIPWGKVAAEMGDRFSEGAIVQHLSKLRAKMLDTGHRVPPQLKRGMVTKEPSKIYAPAGKRKAGEASVPKPSDTIISASRRASKGKAKKNSKRMSEDDSEIENSVEEELYDSDEEWGSTKKKPRFSAKGKGKELTAKQVATSNVEDVPKKAEAETGVVKKVEPGLENAEDEDVQPSIEEDSLILSTRTRGIKADYAKINGSEAEEEDELADVEEDEEEEEEYLEGEDVMGENCEAEEDDGEAHIKWEATMASTNNAEVNQELIAPAADLLAPLMTPANNTTLLGQDFMFPYQNTAMNTGFDNFTFPQPNIYAGSPYMMPPYNMGYGQSPSTPQSSSFPTTRTSSIAPLLTSSQVQSGLQMTPTTTTNFNNMIGGMQNFGLGSGLDMTLTANPFEDDEMFSGLDAFDSFFPNN